MPLSTGTQLGRYTVLKPLVSGGMAEVLLARATGMVGFQHHVVIKCIRANKSTDPQFINTFLDEARLAASLHHNHIVQVHDVGREDNDFFFAMEYIHGEDLRKMLTRVARARELIPLDQILTIVIAVASALHHAHIQRAPDGTPLGLVHRDVTPANILIGYDGNVKVCDFGIAKAALRSSEATKAGTLRGKVAYMAPEQCLGRQIDRRSDIFALGIVLYELVTCRRLFKGETDFLVMTSIVNGKIPKPTEHRADLPLDLEDVILKALAPKPELRYASAEDFALALEKVATNNMIRVSSGALAEYMKQIFGTRPEPWLVNTGLEVVDVDFDGQGSGIVQVPGNEDKSDPTIDRELMESPVLNATSSGDMRANDFDEDPRTEISDDEEDPPTLSGGDQGAAAKEAARILAAQRTSGFEDNERTLISAEDDVDVLVGLSKIPGRPTPQPEPRAPTPAPEPRAATPVPVAPQPVRTPPLPQRPSTPRGDETKVPRGDTTPIPRGDLTPPPPVGSSTGPVAPLGYSTGPAQPVSNASGAWSNPEKSGTPMAWVPTDGEVPSLAPRGRRFVLIAAVAVPLVILGVFFITRNRGSATPAHEVTPDAFVEMSVDAMSVDAPSTDAATKPDAAIKPSVGSGSATPAAGSAATKPVVKPPVVKGGPKPPITKKPPLIKKRPGVR